MVWIEIAFSWQNQNRTVITKCEFICTWCPKNLSYVVFFYVIVRPTRFESLNTTVIITIQLMAILFQSRAIRILDSSFTNMESIINTHSLVFMINCLKTKFFWTIDRLTSLQKRQICSTLSQEEYISASMQINSRLQLHTILNRTMIFFSTDKTQAQSICWKWIKKSDNNL